MVVADDESALRPRATYRSLDFDFSLTGDVAADVAPTFASFAGPVGALQDISRDRPAPTTSFELRRIEAGDHELVIDGTPRFRTGDLGALVHQTVWEITQRAVATRPDAIVLHAAVVGVGDSLVAIAGPSGSGKSTLAASLVARGAEYHTDEAAVLDDDGSVVGAVRRPIHLSRESLRLLDLVDAPVVPMPGGGGYLTIADPPVTDLADPRAPERLVVVVLDETGGELSVDVPRASHVVARLVGDGFTAASRTIRGLRSIKNASSGSALLAISGGSIADRANAVMNVAEGG